MAPCRFCKHQGVAAGVLALLAALVVVGLALPGGAAAQGQDGDKVVVIPASVQDACRRSGLERLLSCASGQEEDIQGCCNDLMFVAAARFVARVADDCACGVLKVIEGRGIDVNNVCKTTGDLRNHQRRLTDTGNVRCEDGLRRRIGFSGDGTKRN
ncbi:hypothetical protein SETIT_3G352000v2 [Setaria italica]|uniref:Bifunctional inhibitor/plant lipid transfer protein/seed storage helical domain-containing protein n=1 Tax=Setaria italica TaxID=4555 RepID=A0A368QP56_SETIT|nr:hypothetical protein SETIT_3G352000v2 [Setaria italica]